MRNRLHPYHKGDLIIKGMKLLKTIEVHQSLGVFLVQEVAFRDFELSRYSMDAKGIILQYLLKVRYSLGVTDTSCL